MCPRWSRAPSARKPPMSLTSLSLFDRPPTVRLEGTVPLRGHLGANFAGGHRRRAPSPGGNLICRKIERHRVLARSNHHADQRSRCVLTAGSHAVGDGLRLRLHQKNGNMIIQFDVHRPTNFNLGVPCGGPDSRSHSHGSKGTAQASLTITSPPTLTIGHSWNGYGHATKLRDGWILGNPDFWSVLSVTIKTPCHPGLGNSRCPRRDCGICHNSRRDFPRTTLKCAPTPCGLQYTGTLEFGRPRRSGRTSRIISGRLGGGTPGQPRPLARDQNA